MKRCKHCKQELALAEFPRYGNQCKKCKTIRALLWRKNNPERDRINRKNYNWKKYGINMTFEEFELLVEDQKGQCKICGVVPPDRDLAVDHDHETGRIRGLLCSGCNRTLSWVERNWSPLMSYLQVAQ